MRRYIYNKDPEYNAIYDKNLRDHDSFVKSLQEEFGISDEELYAEENRINTIETRSISITLMMIPKGAPRPRSSGSHGDAHFYVKGASKMRTVMKNLIDEGIICTGTEMYFDFYIPTPINKLSKMETLLAERKVIRPLVEPDFDNLPKGYTDALQNVLLLNDKIVYRGYIEKYYSLQPRIEILIKYKVGFDCKYNEDKVHTSKNFKELIK